MLLYVNDLLASPKVAAMDDEQFAWYLRMLMRAWMNEPACLLPNSDHDLMIAAGCKSAKKWSSRKALVLSCWVECEGGKFLTQTRLQLELAKMMAVSDKRAKAGRQSGVKRQLTLVEQKGTHVEQKAATQMSDVRCHIHKELKVKSQDSAFALPSWVPVIQWAAFMEIRKKKRAPNTDHALNLIVKKLDEFRARGHPPVQVLDLAIERGWQSVFEPKSEGNGNGRRPSTSEQRQQQDFANIDAAADRLAQAADESDASDVPKLRH